MRLRTISLVAALAGITWLGVFLWPQEATPPAALQPAPAPEPSYSVSAAPLPQTQAEPNRKTPVPSTYIEGITTDISGSPLEGTDILHRLLTIAADQRCHDMADIELELDNSTELLTSDSRGRFVLPFQSLSPSDGYRYCLLASAHKQGYVAATVTMPLDMEELPRLVEIELSPNRAISGQVLAPSNRPVDGASVMAWQAQESTDEQENCGTEEPAATSNSSARGDFTMHVAHAADYCIQAFHPNWSRSQPYTVTSADLTGLRLQLGHRADVSGTAVDLQGVPLANLTLKLVAQQPADVRDQEATTTNRNGNFAFTHLDKASYRLISGSSDYQVAEPEEIVVSEATRQQDVTVTVFPVTTVSGHVFDAFGQPLAQAAVTAYSPYSKNATLADAVSNAQGEFSLPSLHRSKMALESFRMATAMLEGANRPFAGELCLDVFHPHHGSQTWAFTATSSTLNVGSVHLQRPAIKIEGRVLNHRNQGIAATLVVAPDGPKDGQALEARMPGCDDSALSRQISTDPTGQFSFNLPEAGTYRLEVRTDRYQARTFQLDFASSDSNVEIKLD